MRSITTTEQLAVFCAEAAAHPFVTVDTEFLRERTYYAQLCLVQLAYPGEGVESAAIVDTLEAGLSLAPLYELFANPKVVKVFHAARQDLEIFYFDGKMIPAPLFDTQVAAMVCGFGEQVGYDTLVRQICQQPVDKSSRFTDWSRRPLSEKQRQYALGDVTHLRDVYLHLSQSLAETGRRAWVEEELAILGRPETYVVDPDTAWMRLKTRTNSGKFLAIARELARYREEQAKARNVPRGRIFKDDVLLEIAAAKPANAEEAGRLRLLQREGRRGEVMDGILAAVKTGNAVPRADQPVVADTRGRKSGNDGLSELLRVLLKARAESAGVAQKLIATSADIEAIASGELAGVATLSGWRREVFGADAERLLRGEIALSASPEGVKIIEI